MLKNFSSLKAIISGLQSNPIYRLKKAWSYVLREKLEIFEELARIFSGENNALAQRELLVREGTARFADTVGENDHHMQRILQKHSENSRVFFDSNFPLAGILHNRLFLSRPSAMAPFLTSALFSLT